MIGGSQRLADRVVGEPECRAGIERRSHEVGVRSNVPGCAKPSPREADGRGPGIVSPAVEPRSKEGGWNKSNAAEAGGHEGASVDAVIDDRGPLHIGSVVHDHVALYITAVTTSAHHFAAIGPAADDGALTVGAVVNGHVGGVDVACLAALLDVHSFPPGRSGGLCAGGTNSFWPAAAGRQRH